MREQLKWALSAEAPAWVIVLTVIVLEALAGVLFVGWVHVAGWALIHHSGWMLPALFGPFVVAFGVGYASYVKSLK